MRSSLKRLVVLTFTSLTAIGCQSVERPKIINPPEYFQKYSHLSEEDLRNLRLLDRPYQKARKITPIIEGHGDEWQTPKETERLKRGDCEDITKYLIFELEKDGIKAEFVIGSIKYAGKYHYHAWVEVEISGKKYLLDGMQGIKEPLFVENRHPAGYIKLGDHPKYEKHEFSRKLKDLQDRINQGQ